MNENQNISREDLAREIGFAALNTIEKYGISADQSKNKTEKIRGTSTLSSAEIGIRGEDETAAILSKKYKVSRAGKKSCDLRADRGNYSLYYEVKDYSRPVPSAEKEKFIRDINLIRPIGAIFVSLRSPISGIPSDTSLQYENISGAQIPLLYLTQPSGSALLSCSEFMFDLAESMIINRAIAGHINFEKLRGDVDGISASRQSLQVRVGEFVSSFTGACGNMILAEQNIRNTIFEANQYYCCGSAEECIRGLSDFAKLTDEQKTNTRRVISAGGESRWKGSKKKMHCALFSIDVSKFPSAMFSRAAITDDEIIRFAQSSSEVKIDRGSVCVEISPQTVELVCSVINGEEKKIRSPREG